ncbi:MAG: hypothetical protein N2Z79_04325, partial [Candidatus Omnitrophica bacterium]|nr:hypothetical protein [Candidatus Omnitrophota bacterium]
MKTLLYIKRILKSIYKFSQRERKKLYIVGGFLRDYLLGKREFLDIDFCLKSSSINFSRKLAYFLKMGFVILDKEHSSTRLVKKTKYGLFTIDFNNWRAKTLKEDLFHRDFTINTLALELKDFFNKEGFERKIIDYYNAKEDLKDKLIRVVNKRAFDEDPLRILRAFSLACLLDFKIEPQTLNLIKFKAKKVAGVAGERIRDELFKILETHKSADYFRLMDELGVLEVIFPEINSMRNVQQGPYHHLDVWKHSIQTQKEADLLVEELMKNPEIREYLEVVLSGTRTRRSLLKLASLFHDIGKPKALVYRGGKTTFYGHE